MDRPAGTAPARPDLWPITVVRTTDGIEQPLRDLIEHIDGIIYEIEADTLDFTYVSPAAESILGYPRQRWYERGFWARHVYPEDLLAAESFWQGEVAAGRPHALEYRMYTADGRIAWIQDRLAPGRRADGRVYFSGVMIDVTNLKEAEQTVRLIEELTSHHVGDGFFRSLVVGLTRALGVRVAALAEVELEGGKLTGVAVASDGELAESIECGAADDWSEVLAGSPLHVGWGLRERFPNHPTFGAENATSCLAVPLIDSNGDTIGVLTILDSKPLERTRRVDTAFSVFVPRATAELERRRAERQRENLRRQLVQAQKMEAIGTLAGGIAHDLNNVLMGILGNAEIAQEELPGWHPSSANLREIVRATTRARDVVQRILTFSRDREPERQPLSLRTVVDEAFVLLRATLPSTIDIQLDHSPESAIVLANASQLHQVILNLAANAAHAMRGQQGTLRLSESVVVLDADLVKPHVGLEPGRFVRLTVADTGTGVEPATLSRIFEPFFTTKPPGEGTGLGLSVVHGIVRDHDGAIAVESRVGLGTTFHLYFPVVDAVPRPADEDHGQLPRGAGQRILFVDDEPAIVRVGRRMLGRLGYAVSGFDRAQAALDALASDPEAYALIISDLTMPGLTGLEMARRARAIKPSVPIILTTGNTDFLETDRPAEVDLVLPKPFATARLAQAVHDLAAKPAD